MTTDVPAEEWFTDAATRLLKQLRDKLYAFDRSREQNVRYDIPRPSISGKNDSWTVEITLEAVTGGFFSRRRAPLVKISMLTSTQHTRHTIVVDVFDKDDESRRALCWHYLDVDERNALLSRQYGITVRARNVYTEEMEFIH